MTDFEPACLAVPAGSLPLTDPRAACNLVLRCFPAIPTWPQLPRLSRYEELYLQFCERLPGLVVESDPPYVERKQVEQGLEQLYMAYLDDETGPFGAAFGSVSAPYAEGLAMLLSQRLAMGEIVAIKGQVAGPISLGLHVADSSGQPILFDEVLADATAKLLRLKAAWQEKQLRRFSRQSLIFVEEPCLAGFGTPDLPIGRDQVLAGLEEVFSGISGLKGLHCCGAPDWSLLLGGTTVDVISFDAYHYAEPFARHAPAIKTFLRRGGIIAWGIIPAAAEALAADGETAESLAAKLRSAMGLLVQAGVPRDELLRRALVTSSCGLGNLPVPAAIRACELANEVASIMR